VALATIVESWRSLVTPYTGQSLVDLLKEANADYDVVLNPVYSYDKFRDDYVPINNQFVTGRYTEVDGVTKFESWQVVKGRYSVVSNLSIAKKAKLLADQSDSLFLHGCGILDNGRRFFCILNAGSLQIDLAKTKTDVIENYVVLITSHDGSVPITYYNLDVRKSTSAVIRFSSQAANFSLRKRHTPNEAELNILSEVAEAARMRSLWTSELQKTIRSLLVPISPYNVDLVLETVWSEADAETDKIRENIKTIKQTIKNKLASPHNAGTYGVSKWALLNAVCEFIDFDRNISAKEASQHALEIDNQSHRLKIKAHVALTRL